jgi:hypothetical protein
MGNKVAPPLFMDADGPDDDPHTWQDNDYRLRAGSSCIDSGDPNYVLSAGETDLDGHLRTWDGDGGGAARLDMGCYEFGSRSFGDTNCDGAVDFDDIGPFVRALVGKDVYEGAYPECNWLLADCNRDGYADFDDINPFVLALLGQEAYGRRYADCRWLNGDTKGDGAVDFDDINPFAALLAAPSPRVAGYWNSGCLLERGSGGCAAPDEVALTVEGHTLHAVHRNATCNCCVDDIVIRLSVQGSLLLLTEEEVLTRPCFCICCYDVEATIAGLASGTYTVQFCWYDYEMQGAQCVTQVIVIP